MYDKAASRYEDGLKAILKSISTKGGTKNRDKVNERLGRLRSATLLSRTIMRSHSPTMKRML
jgi:hypothetical protein